MDKQIYLLILSFACVSCQKQPATTDKTITRKTGVEKKNQHDQSQLVSSVLSLGQSSSIKPVVGSRVRVHYTGWIAKEDGTPGREIDTSLKRGEPFEFTVGVGDVIRGFDEGVQLMCIGEKRRLIIPPALGYGEHGVGLFIPPHSTLIFDIELIAVSA